MALGYGSEYQLLRYLGHHRNYLNNKIQEAIGDGPIEWEDYPVNTNRYSLDGELKDIECFNRLPNYSDIKRNWKEFWPQSGNSHNWDGVFKQNGIWFFVEAKAHLNEANQKCSATSHKSIETIIKAFELTCGKRTLAEIWQESNCYQLANRLAFIHFCKDNQIDAKLLYINFINGYNIKLKNVTDENIWKAKWEEEYDVLKISDDLKTNIYHVYIDCNEG